VKNAETSDKPLPPGGMRDRLDLLAITGNRGSAGIFRSCFAPTEIIDTTQFDRPVYFGIYKQIVDVRAAAASAQ